MSTPFTNPRDVAVAALRDRDGNVSAHLDRLLAEGRLGPVDRAFARELALGALRRRGTLRSALERLLDFPIDQLRHGAMLNIFDVALYQIFFLDRVPPFAAVNEAVEQTARFTHRKKAGLVNGVLRSLLRSLGPVEQGAPPLEANVIAASATQFRRSERPLLPEPSREAEFLAAACSLPLALARRWLTRFGPLPRAFALGMQANARAPLVLRVNRLKASPAELLSRFEAEGISAAAHENGVSVVLLESRNVAELPGFDEGWFQPQDATATAVGQACAALGLFSGEGAAVLDFCAAPGTKTTHLAELMGTAGVSRGEGVSPSRLAGILPARDGEDSFSYSSDPAYGSHNAGELAATKRSEDGTPASRYGSGTILALDVSGEKLAKIEENCRRLGVTNVTTGLTQQAGGLAPASFDVVLADVPCSNTGVLARRAEARWRFDEASLGPLVRDQHWLASTAWRFVKPGGHFVYSTCSIEPEECADVIRRLIRQCGGEMVREHLTLPSGPAPTSWRDGGYYAVLRARSL